MQSPARRLFILLLALGSTAVGAQSASQRVRTPPTTVRPVQNTQVVPAVTKPAQVDRRLKPSDTVKEVVPFPSAKPARDRTTIENHGQLRLAQAPNLAAVWQFIN